MEAGEDSAKLDALAGDVVPILLDLLEPYLQDLKDLDSLAKSAPQLKK